MRQRKSGRKAPGTGSSPALLSSNGNWVSADICGCTDGKVKGAAHVALVTSDWSGGTRFFEKDLFQSMNEHTYNEKTSEVRFKSRIILKIYDAIKCHESIIVANPENFFEQGNNDIFSTVLYYGERTLRTVEPQCIGGMDGIGPKKLSKVRDICVVKLQFANGKPVYRTFINLGATTKVMPIRLGRSREIVAYRPPQLDEVGVPVTEFRW
ncbi:hypothetical protein C8A01DRAFT_21549 [Parachaetomium inaequale]|uniref:Uncharacterized protein n=1 Tax=Parachaetomium inaequale TaxID=2588326 RepID=A0AAN6SKP4_9PEZI|nr:hypothetical protein C8A01DRAFT_21549 [Parachaetomium inaequale]